MLSEWPKWADTPWKCSRWSIAQTVFHIWNTVNHLVFNDYTLPWYVLEWRWKENKKLIRKRVSNDITPHWETYGDILWEVWLHDKLICIWWYIFCFIDPRKWLNICKPSMNWLREIKAFPRDYIFDESTTNSTDWIWEDNDWKLYLIFVVNKTSNYMKITTKFLLTSLMLIFISVLVNGQNYDNILTQKSISYKTESDVKSKIFVFTE